MRRDEGGRKWRRKEEEEGGGRRGQKKMRGKYKEGMLIIKGRGIEQYEDIAQFRKAHVYITSRVHRKRGRVLHFHISKK